MAKRLTYEDRIRLETLLKVPLLDEMGFYLNQTQRIKKLSDCFGVNPSTIYREVIGNNFTYETYNAKDAQIKVSTRISKANKHPRYSEEQKLLILNVVLIIFQKIITVIQ